MCTLYSASIVRYDASGILGQFCELVLRKVAVGAAGDHHGGRGDLAQVVPPRRVGGIVMGLRLGQIGLLANCRFASDGFRFATRKVIALQ